MPRSKTFFYNSPVGASPLITRALIELVKGRWREFCREPSALFFVVLMPVVWMLILGYAIDGKRRGRVTIGLAAPDGQTTELYRRVSGVLNQSASFKTTVDQREDLERLLRTQKLVLVVEVASDKIIYTYDNTNPQSNDARILINDYIQKQFGRSEPLPTIDQPAAVAGQRYVDFLIPGLIALSIMTSSLFGTGMTVVTNRRDGLLKRYLATPMRTQDYILSHIIGRLFILGVELTAILVAAKLFFGFTVKGDLLSLALFSILGASTFTALSLLCATRARNTAVVNGATNLIALPLMMVSGIWFARSNFPEWLNRILDYTPLVQLVDGLRAIALEGISPDWLSLNSMGPLAYTVIFGIASKALFRWV